MLNINARSGPKYNNDVLNAIVISAKCSIDFVFRAMPNIRTHAAGLDDKRGALEIKIPPR